MPSTLVFSLPPDSTPPRVCLSSSHTSPCRTSTVAPLPPRPTSPYSRLHLSLSFIIVSKLWLSTIFVQLGLIFVQISKLSHSCLLFFFNCLILLNVDFSSTVFFTCVLPCCFSGLCLIFVLLLFNFTLHFV